MVGERDLDNVLREIRETGVDLSLHESLTPDRVLGRLREAEADGELIGFCRSCGAEHSGIERDAVGHECPACAAATVEGADEMIMRTAVFETIRAAIREGRIETPPAERAKASEEGSDADG